MKLQTNLRKFRFDHRLSQKALGELVGVAAITICKWENGSHPHGPNYDRVSKFLRTYKEPAAFSKYLATVQVKSPVAAQAPKVVNSEHSASTNVQKFMAIFYTLTANEQDCFFSCFFLNREAGEQTCIDDLPF